MSLVNDALRRAKDTAPKSAAPAIEPMRAVETGQRRQGSDFLLAMLIVVILLLAGLLLWQWFLGSGAELKVRAKAVPAVSREVSSPVVSQELPVATQTVPETIPDKAAAAATDTAAATRLAVVEPPKPKPITYKLQSVVYLPGNPSAVINDKVVFVGDRMDGAWVMSIGPGTATIVTSAGQTNVLVMPP
jgi:cytoskeletal protein RodZ